MFIKDLTFVIFTFNEESRIETVIKNFINFAHILVVDNYSTDQTLAIAKKYGCKILMNKNQGWVEDELTVSRVKEAVETNWIYWAYADEFIDLKVLNAINEVVVSDSHDIINLKRKNYFYGKFCYGAFSDRMNRIFKKDAIDFMGNTIHRFGSIKVAKNKIKYFPDSLYVHHFISHTASVYYDIVNKYSSSQAKMEYRTKGVSIFRLWGKSLKIFILDYIFRGGFRGGAPVIFLVFIMISYQWMVETKNYELTNNLIDGKVEDLNNQIRNRLLSEIK